MVAVVSLTGAIRRLRAVLVGSDGGLRLATGRKCDIEPQAMSVESRGARGPARNSQGFGSWVRWFIRPAALLNTSSAALAGLR